MSKDFKSFREFYPFYLSEHTDKTCRLLHVVGTSLAILMFWYFIFTAQYTKIILVPVVGYGLAWVGHFVFEKNKPAAFKYPIYSFMGDMVMLKSVLMGKIKIF